MLLLFGSALDAYSFGPFPLQWIVQLGSIAAAVYLGLRYPVPRPIGYRWLWILFSWSVLVTAGNLFFNDYASLMPTAAAIPYSLFIVLRVLTLLSFIASLYLVYWLLHRCGRDHIVVATLLIGTTISIAAVYIYVAQIYSLPELPRTRLGTGGGSQAITFTYDFHRATGTFREPSLLAAWLVAPLFLSLTTGRWLSYLQAIPIGGAILLTGSLAGIVAIAFGLVVATLIAFLTGARNVRSLVRVGAAIPVAIAVFYLFSVSNTGHGVDLFATISDRVGPIVLNGGLAQSDRNYIYDYVYQAPPSLVGYGLGNANLVFGQYLGSALVASFISLYVYSLYSTGLIGFALLCCFLAAPLWAVAADRELRHDSHVIFSLAPYFAWLVLFGVAVEEFTFMFAVVCAFMGHELLSRRSSGRALK